MIHAAKKCRNQLVNSLETALLPKRSRRAGDGYIRTRIHPPTVLKSSRSHQLLKLLTIQYFACTALTRQDIKIKRYKPILKVAAHNIESYSICVLTLRTYTLASIVALNRCPYAITRDLASLSDEQSDSGAIAAGKRVIRLRTPTAIKAITIVAIIKSIAVLERS